MKNVALITGGASGIGFEASKKLAQLGYDLHIVYRKNHDRAAQSKETLLQINPSINVITECIDLSEAGQADFFGKEFVSRYKDNSIKVFISSHGRTSPGLFIQKKIDLILKTITEHLISNIILSRHLLKPMCVNKYGRMIFITSVSSHKINQGQADYALSKGALETFVKSLTSEYYHRNITFNCLALGLTKTPATEDLLKNLPSNLQANLVPLEQVGSVFELLLKEASSFISGSTFILDAGQLNNNNNSPYHRLSFYVDEKGSV